MRSRRHNFVTSINYRSFSSKEIMNGFTSRFKSFISVKNGIFLFMYPILRWFFAQGPKLCLISEILVPSGAGGGKPMFMAPVMNATVVHGRNATLSCPVADLGHYKVKLIRQTLFHPCPEYFSFGQGCAGQNWPVPCFAALFFGRLLCDFRISLSFRWIFNDYISKLLNIS